MPNPFTVRVFKSFLSRENKVWSNSYEVCKGDMADASYGSLGGEETLTVALADSAITQIVAFERQIHLPQVQFIRAVASTWVPDSDPYDPFNLMTVELEGTGTRAEGVAGVGDNIDLRNVVKIQRRGALGKAGQIEYRGCLEKGDVENSGGRWELVDGNSFQDDLFAALSAFTTLVTPGEPEQPRMCLIGGTLVKTPVPATEGGVDIIKVRRTYVAPYHLRKVVSVTYHGVGVRKQDNKSFDRP